MNYVVYVIAQHYSKGRVKIGFTGNINARLKQIQTGNPMECNILGLLKCNSKKHAMTIESEIHRICDPYRSIGEWFTWGAVNLIKTKKYDFDWLDQPSLIDQEYNGLPEDLKILAKKYKKQIGGKIRRRSGSLKPRTIEFRDRLFEVLPNNKLVKQFCHLERAPAENDYLELKKGMAQVGWSGKNGQCSVVFFKTRMFFSSVTFSGRIASLRVKPSVALIYVNAISLVSLNNSELIRLGINDSEAVS